jgi:hypothetical protein
MDARDAALKMGRDGPQLAGWARGMGRSSGWGARDGAGWALRLVQTGALCSRKRCHRAALLARRHEAHARPAQEWLWCETWCGNTTKAAARTIDLCNNPLTKEPKLTGARRIVAEWPALDAEVGAFTAQARARALP